MKNEQASARTADAVQFMQLRVAAKDVVQLVEYMLQHGEWYLAEERIERLRNALEGSVCPACGSDRNERDELDKAEREIERLRSAPATLQQAEPVAWMAFGGALVHAVTRNAMDPIEAERFDVPLYLHPPAAPQQAEPVEQIGWSDEFGNLFPMGAWKPAQRTHHDSHKTAWRPVFLHPPAAEVQRLREALEYLIEKCGDSDDAQYSTLGTKFVRDIARRALEGGE